MINVAWKYVCNGLQILVADLNVFIFFWRIHRLIKLSLRNRSHMLGSLSQSAGVKREKKTNTNFLGKKTKPKKIIVDNYVGLNATGLHLLRITRKWPMFRKLKANIKRNQKNKNSKTEKTVATPNLVNVFGEMLSYWYVINK